MSIARSLSSFFRTQPLGKSGGNLYGENKRRPAASANNIVKSLGAPPENSSDQKRSARETKSLSKWAVQLAFGSAGAILLFVGALSYRSVLQSSERNDWVAHTRDVLENIHSVRLSMETMASGVRGFAL